MERDRDNRMWQTIDTAPKDGSSFLSVDESGFISVAWWDNATFDGEGQWMSERENSAVPRGTAELTHWMPLPELPPEHMQGAS